MTLLEVMEKYKLMRKDYENDNRFIHDNNEYIYKDLKRLGIEEGSFEWSDFFYELFS